MSATDVIAMSKLQNILIPPSKTPAIKACTFIIFLPGKDDDRNNPCNCAENITNDQTYSNYNHFMLKCIIGDITSEASSSTLHFEIATTVK